MFQEGAKSTSSGHGNHIMQRLLIISRNPNADESLEEQMTLEKVLKESHVHASVDDLESYLERRLPSTAVHALESHLANCEPCEARMGEAADRILWNTDFPTDIEAHVKLVDPVTSTAGSAPARILSLSKTAMKVKMSRHVVYKMLLQIRYNGKFSLTEVRYCRSVGSEFHVGVRILEEFPR